MKNFKSLLSVFVLLAIFLSSCSLPEKEKTTDEKIKEAIDGVTEDITSGINEGTDDLSNAIDDIGKALGGLDLGKGKVPIVHFRDLKPFFPKSVAGIEHGKVTGETTGMAGFKYSTAKTKYDDGKVRIEMNILDGGGVGAIMSGIAAWSKFDVDRETDDGYERTTTFDGYKAYEKYNENRKRGEISLLVNDRFVVRVEGRGVDMDDLKKAIKNMNLRKLARMKGKEE